MASQRTAGVISALVAAITLTGCTHHHPVVEPVEETPGATTTAAASTAPLPAPELLTDVLYRLADPAVPGADKLTLIEGAKPDDAATIDRFTTALRDGGYLPLTFNADDVGWSSRNPGSVSADINATTANPDYPNFMFPMEFKPFRDGWQLSHETAGLLLSFGRAHADSSSSTPAPEPAPPR